MATDREVRRIVVVWKIAAYRECVVLIWRLCPPREGVEKKMIKVIILLSRRGLRVEKGLSKRSGRRGLSWTRPLIFASSRRDRVAHCWLLLSAFGWRARCISLRGQTLIPLLSRSSSRRGFSFSRRIPAYPAQSLHVAASFTQDPTSAGSPLGTVGLTGEQSSGQEVHK